MIHYTPQKADYGYPIFVDYSVTSSYDGNTNLFPWSKQLSFKS